MKAFKDFIITLLKSPTEELYSVRVSVDCHVPMLTKMDDNDLGRNRVMMWRATEKGVMAYEQYCRMTEQKREDIISMIVTGV